MKIFRSLLERERERERQAWTDLMKNWNNWKDTGVAHRMKGNTQKPGLKKNRTWDGAEISTARALDHPSGKDAFSALAPTTYTFCLHCLHSRFKSRKTDYYWPTVGHVSTPVKQWERSIVGQKKTNGYQSPPVCWPPRMCRPLCPVYSAPCVPS